MIDHDKYLTGDSSVEYKKGYAQLWTTLDTNGYLDHSGSGKSQIYAFMMNSCFKKKT